MSTAGPAHRVQSAVVEYGYPQGHLGHLTDAEETAFQQFKTLCAEKGYYKAGEGDDIATHEDATLLRYLRARRFHVQDAWKQFEDTEKWRKANELEKLYETIDLDHYEETRRLYPQWTGRRDRRGIPVYVFEVKHLNSKTMSAYEKSATTTATQAKTDGKTSPKLLRLFALYENLTRFVMPLCTALSDRNHPRTPITQSNNIVDISGVGLKQFWNLRTHMQDASTLATAYYPETLDRIFAHENQIIGAPAFFPTVWSWIKKWFDPITTSKIFILSSSDMKRTLESFIEPANIPQKYGGQLEFAFGDMPVLDPAMEHVLEWKGDRKDFPRGPMYWVEKKGEDKIEAIAVGHVDEKQRHETVCTIKTLPKETETETETEKEKSALLNGAAKPKPDILTLPTEPSSPLDSQDQTNPSVRIIAPTPESATVSQGERTFKGEKVVEEGEVVPASRPEPVSFVTASEWVENLSLQGKEGTGLPNGIVEMEENEGEEEEEEEGNQEEKELGSKEKSKERNGQVAL
ncbi:hypothetical protein B7494_g109 [Chlorociboria aeruginascens]|nr:hypothetical protein B7494_g109 [Chlorociboria aeruginascens]